MKPKNGYTRRDFLKIVGATGGVVAAGCSEKVPEKLIPYVIQPDEVIPGVSTWYSGSCTECAAGCGIMVRTREGRALKLEGNPLHPINRGALCAQGQSALQSLYDPDRIRQPLLRSKTGELQPVTWEQALKEIDGALSAVPADRSTVFLTQPLSGSLAALANELTGKLPNAQRVEFELFGSDVIDVAAEQCFGPGYRTHYDFSQADVIVSVGADFLETWVSPVEFSRQWAERRRPENGRGMSYFAHVEPRMSLTGGSADEWFKNQPGTESEFLLGLLRGLLDLGAGSALPAGTLREITNVVQSSTVAQSEKNCGLADGSIKRLAGALKRASTSIVVVGGTSPADANAGNSAVLGNLINLVLGNVGKSVKLWRAEGKKATYRYQDLLQLTQAMLAKKVGVLLISGVNPAFALPQFPNAASFQKALAEVGFVIAVSTHLDETTSLANVVLPLSTSLESWTDSEPAPGVVNLSQPAMQPVYSTQGLGDSLLSIAAKHGITFGSATGMYDYMRMRWKKALGDSDFENRWTTCVQRGGLWDEKSLASVSVPPLQSSATQVTIAKKETSSDGLTLLAFPIVNFFDGRLANRPWMQEIPPTLSNVVWGSWIEIHSTLAQKLGVKTGDPLRVSTAAGAINSSAFVTDLVHPLTVAVPIGQGHVLYGRYASSVGANPLSVLPMESKGPMHFSTAALKVEKGNWPEELVLLQMHNSQEGRPLLRTVKLSEYKKLAANGAYVPVPAKHAETAQTHKSSEPEAHESEEHEEIGALGPKETPRQMYSQMDHPLYRWGMSVDINTCTGCSACVVACYAENNIPVVGKTICKQGREMSWIRIDRYFDGGPSQPVSGFMPMMCQQCGNAPCEPVCPVYATYHNEQGLNVMVYNRCVGTRYCSNNCSYKVRRFNWFKYDWAEPANWQLNPDITVREVGVMEKCTFCIQRIKEVEHHAKDEGREIRDGEVQPACAATCPTRAITFGNLKDVESKVSEQARSVRGYKCLDEELNTQPAITYLARVLNDSFES